MDFQSEKYRLLYQNPEKSYKKEEEREKRQLLSALYYNQYKQSEYNDKLTTFRGSIFLRKEIETIFIDGEIFGVLAISFQC